MEARCARIWESNHRSLQRTGREKMELLDADYFGYDFHLEFTLLDAECPYFCIRAAFN